MGQAQTQTLEQMYHLALQDLLILEQPQPALLHVRGPDGLDLINRMSTNDLAATSSREPLTTVFTNANARIVEIATVLPENQEQLLLCWQDSPKTLSNWLGGYIFYQDDVHLEPAAAGWRLLEFIGPNSQTIYPKTEQHTNGDNRSYTRLEMGFLWRQPLGKLERMRLLIQGEWTEHIQASTDLLMPVQNRQIYELLRIEAGIPAFGAEIKEDTIPLEVGLWENVSFTKGCYIGQEIIARMESRGKLANTLIGLQSERALEVGSTLHLDGRSIGQITSSARSPQHGEIGLAIVKTSSIHGDSSVRTDADQTVLIQGLPFH